MGKRDNKPINTQKTKEAKAETKPIKNIKGIIAKFIKSILNQN